MIHWKLSYFLNRSYSIHSLLHSKPTKLETLTTDGQLLSFLLVSCDRHRQPCPYKYKRMEVADKLGISVRDVRLCDPAFHDQMYMFGVREGAILLKLGTISGFIQHNRMLLFNPGTRGVRIIGERVWHAWRHRNQVLEEGRRDGNEEIHTNARLGDRKLLSFELLCLQEATRYVLSDLQSEVDQLHDGVTRNLARQTFEDRGPSVKILQDTLIQKTSLQSLYMKIANLKSTTKNILGADEDMASMYLTDFQMGNKREESDHAEVEVMFEIWYQMLEEMQLDIESMRASILHREELSRLQLDSRRNDIMQLELRVSVLTCCLTASALLAGLFGMNLQIGFESSIVAFWTVFGGTWLSTAILYMIATKQCISYGLLQPVFRRQNFRFWNKIFKKIF
eukprot:GHVL01027841.1.p1 GENE.GHVL01027841.1~~GHVL01027841.1.p1  ORF type:complete len:394 (+),score=49.55 GHVL01027841.1:1260-2441(+)